MTPAASKQALRTAIKVIGHVRWRSLATRSANISAASTPPMNRPSGTKTYRHRDTGHFYIIVFPRPISQISHKRSRGISNPFVINTLGPRDQTQCRQDLRLNPECDVEILDDAVDAQWQAGGRPEEHHRRLQALRVMTAVVDDDLRYQLSDHS